MDRKETIKQIKTALQRRSGKQWSVTGGKGTAWGWLNIESPPSRRTWSHRLKANASFAKLPEDYEPYDSGEPGRNMSPEDCAELKTLLGLESNVSEQGESIPASQNYWQEYIDRAEGRTPTVKGEIYWD